MWATKRKGSGKKKSTSDSKRRTKSSEDELHDFIHDIEYSAKKILKQHMKRKVKEAAREKMMEQRNRIKANKMKSPSHGGTNTMGMSSSGGGYSTLGQSGAMPSPGSTLGGGSTWGPQTDEPGAMRTFGAGSTQFPKIAGGSQTFQSPMMATSSTMSQSAHVLQGGMTMTNAQSLPSVHQESIDRTARALSQRRKKELSHKDKAKLMQSPFMQTRSKQNAGVNFLENEDEDETAKQMKNELKEAGKSGRQVLREAAQLAGATIKGDVHALAMLRADHGVDRRMSASKWANPDQKTGVEEGMRNLGLILDREDEVQGPTGWSADDLKRKYRDEIEREQAYQAGQEAVLEAERLEREENVIRAVVTIPPHPLKSQFGNFCTMENERSRRRARARNQLKAYSLDLITIWHANRPAHEGKDDDENAHLRNTVKGIKDRRPAHAVKAFNAQVQSVSINRAMQSSIKSSQLKKGWGSVTASGAVEGGGDGEVVLTLAEKDREAEERAKNRRAMWARPWFRGSAKVPMMDVPFETAADQVNCMWTSAPKDKKITELADISLSIFRRGRGNKRRLVLHVHNHEDSSASAVQIDDSKMEFLIQKAAKQMVLNKLADRRAVLARTDADISKRRGKVRDDWKKYLEDREVALEKLKEQRKKDFVEASKAGSTRADMFCTQIDGRYVVVTINVSTSASAPRPSSTCVHIIAYEPLTRERAEVKLPGWEIFRLLPQPPRCKSKEEKFQFDEFEEMELYFTDIFNEEIRLRPSRWDGPVPTHFQSLGKSEVNPTTTPMMERMRWVKVINKWWTNWAERRKHLWLLLIPKLHWEHGVPVKHEVKEHETIVSALRYAIPESIAVPRHKADVEEYETKMKDFKEEHDTATAIVTKDDETKTEQLRVAVERALKKDKGKMILKLISMVPSPEIDEDAEPVPGAPTGQDGQLIVALPGAEGTRLGEVQSSVRGRDEAEEWAAAEEAAREEERLALAEATLSYIVCGAHDGFGKVPGTGIYGLIDVCTGIFRRDPELSSTNSVLVTIATSLETALLCPMLGGYDTIVEQAPPAPEEAVGGPISALVAPISVRQLRSEMNSRITDSIVAFNSDVRPLDYHFEGHRNMDGTQTMYIGHRRNDPERHAKKGFAFWSKQDVSFSDPVIIAKAYGVTQTAAVPNAPGCWPRRHTWHSEELAGGQLAKPRVAIDYAYVSTRRVASGSNDPNIYVSRMDTYKLGQLEMRKLSWWLREEREKAEKEKKEAQMAAIQARIEAGKAMAEKRKSQREALERSERMAKLRAAKRMKGKGRGAGDDPKTWEMRRNRSTIVGITLAAGSGDWVAYMDPETGQQDQGGTIFYHSVKKERETGNGSQWDRPKLWAGVIGGQDMAQAIKEAEPRLRAMGILDFSKLSDDVEKLKEETPRTKEARLATERHNKLVAEREKRLKEKAEEKRKHFVAVRQRLRRFLDERAKINETKYDLRKPFDDFDTNGDGQISMEEFKNTMELLFVGEAVEFYPDELQELASAFDRNGDGFITFAEFCAYAFGESDEFDGVLFVDMGSEDSQRVLDLLAEVDAYTELIDEASGKKYWYHGVSAQSVFDEPPDVIASVKALEAEKALYEQHRAVLKAKEEAERAKAKLSRHSEELPTSIKGFVDKLGDNEKFVEMLAEKLGIKKEEHKKNVKRRRRKNADGEYIDDGEEKEYKEETWELETDSEEEDADSDDEDAEEKRKKLIRPRKIHNKHNEMMRRRLAWRRLKPVKMKQNFVTAATSTNVATAPPGLCICNTASVVGVVDPSQGTTHEEFKTVSVNLDAIKIELDPNKHVPAPGFSAGTLVTQTYVNMKLIPVEVTGRLSEAAAPNSTLIRIIEDRKGSFVTQETPGVDKLGDIIIGKGVNSHNCGRPVLKLEGNVEIILDIMADAERLGAGESVGDGGLSKSEATMTKEEEMLENTHKIFSYVRNAEYDGVDAMLDEGVDVNSADDNGNTPLLVAAQQGLKKIAKLLLRRGANINQTNLAGNTVLHYCFAYSFESLGDYFIKKGADDSIANAEGLTCYEGLSQESVNNI